MSIRLKKKFIYYVLIILALFFMCLRGDLLVEEGVVYSVLDVIKGLPGGRSIDAATAFRSGVTWWVYLLLPVVCIPFASYLSEERKSGYYLFEKERQGTVRYLLVKSVFAFTSSALILFVVIAAYAAVVYYNFDSALSGGWMVFGRQVLAKYAYVQVYAFMLSCMAGLFVYVYNDMYVDISLVLVLNYIFKDIFIKDRLSYPAAALLLTLVLYVVIKKTRCDAI